MSKAAGGIGAARVLAAGKPSAALVADHEQRAWRAVLADPVIWLLVLLGLGLRLLVGLLLPERGFISDEAEYYAAARILADGRGFGYYEAAPWLRPPGYLLFLAALFRLVGESPEPARWVQVGLSLLIGPLTAWLGLLVAGRRAAARLAAAIVMLSLPLAVFPWLLLTETLFILLILVVFVAVLERLGGGARRWLLLAGVALAGTCLLRGLAVGFAGLVIAGLALLGPAGRRVRIGDAALMGVVVLALVLPWTARNAVAYRAVIPLETTAAYNLWLRAQGGRGESWMLGELREQPDPARRQAHALERGLELVRAEPWAYLARGGRELLDVWRLNFGAPERFMRGYSGGEVSRAWLLLSLVLDDLLYLALLPLATLGLARRSGPGRALTLTWIGWTCLSALLFFAITRFRLPLLPLLAVYAAVGLGELGGLGAWLRRRPLAVGATGLLAVALLGVAAASFDGRLYGTGWLARSAWEVATVAEERRRAGEAERALVLLDEAGADVPLVRLTRALALSQRGRPHEAEAQLEPLRGDERALVVQGELRRFQGDQAGAARVWASREVDVANPLGWAWERVGAPSERVEVGDGLDLGLVRGMQADERDGAARYRWTDGLGAVRLALPRPGAATLALRLRAVRPSAAPVEVTILVNGQTVAMLPATADWRDHKVPVYSDRTALLVELRSATFVPGYADPRSLGVMLDAIEVRLAGE